MIQFLLQCACINTPSSVPEKTEDCCWSSSEPWSQRGAGFNRSR